MELDREVAKYESVDKDTFTMVKKVTVDASEIVVELDSGETVSYTVDQDGYGWAGLKRFAGYETIREWGRRNYPNSPKYR